MLARVNGSLATHFSIDYKSYESYEALCDSTELETKIQEYVTEMSVFLAANSLLISVPKSPITLFTPDPHQAKDHPKIKIADSTLPLNRSPKILGSTWTVPSASTSTAAK